MNLKGQKGTFKKEHFTHFTDTFRLKKQQIQETDMSTMQKENNFLSKYSSSKVKHRF